MENPKDRGAWWAAVHGITKSGTHTHALKVMEQGWPGVALGQEGRGCCLSQGPVAGTSESSTMWEMGMAGREGILDMVHVGLGGQGRALGPEVPVSAVRCPLLERRGAGSGGYSLPPTPVKIFLF